MSRYIKITPKKLKALLKYLQINVTKGNLKLEDVYKKIGVSRNAFYRIKTGKTNTVTRNTYIQIEKMIGQYLDDDELIIKPKKQPTKTESIIELLRITNEMLRDSDSSKQIEINALKSRIGLLTKQVKDFNKKTTAISDALKDIIDLKEDVFAEREIKLIKDASRGKLKIYEKKYQNLLPQLIIIFQEYDKTHSHQLNFYKEIFEHYKDIRYQFQEWQNLLLSAAPYTYLMIDYFESDGFEQMETTISWRLAEILDLIKQYLFNNKPIPKIKDTTKIFDFGYLDQFISKELKNKLKKEN